jgi:hypothetical protein
MISKQAGIRGNRALLTAAACALLSGCALFGGKSGIAAPEGANPQLVFAGARMQRGGGQVTAVTLRKTDGKREKVPLRWTGGWDLFDGNSSFYRELVPPGRYTVHVIHFDSGGKTYIQEVAGQFRDFEIKPDGVQFIGEFLVERNGPDLRYRLGGSEVNQKAILAKVKSHLKNTAWPAVLENYGKPSGKP